MPSVKRLYERYNERGFEIVGVSLDENRTTLTTYLHQESIHWRQMFEGNGWNSSIAKRYGVQAIPRTFLIDRQGRIRGVDL
ncbi:MAG: TlpA disulfide reductase family protein, partial [Candidatus Bilamarchaeaceae archaeon]